MPSLRASLLLAVLLSPGLAFAQPDDALWRFVSPHPTALIGIDWGHIRQSQAGAIVRDKLLTTEAISAIPGLELLNDIDRVVISSPGKNPSGDSGEPPLLIAIRGRFDGARVRQIFTRFGAAPQSYNSFQVYRPQAKNAKDMAWVLVDSGTILFGDASSVFAALNQSQFAPPRTEAAALIARVAELAASYEIWAIMNATEVMSSDRLAALFPGGEWASEAQGFEAGFNFRAGLAADIVVRFSTEDTAKHMTAELSRVINMVAKDKSTSAQVQDVARKLKFSLDGSATKISLHLSPLELTRGAQAFAESHKVLPQTVNEPLTPVVPQVIRIEGLDDGPREIPYPQQH